MKSKILPRANTVHNPAEKELDSGLALFVIACYVLSLRSPQGLQSPFFFGTRCNGLSQRLLDCRHNPFCNMNSNSNLIALSFSGARRQALAVTGCLCIIIACDTMLDVFRAIELRVSDENSLIAVYRGILQLC